MEASKRAKWFKPVPFPPWYKRLSGSFRQFFKRQFMVDIVFHCDNNETIAAHKTILCHASPLLKSLLSNNSESFNEDNVIHISMPDISHGLMSDFIESLYLGSTPTDHHSYLGCKELADMFGLFDNDFDFIGPELVRSFQTPSVHGGPPDSDLTSIFSGGGKLPS
jgi:hypothetical protein